MTENADKDTHMGASAGALSEKEAELVVVPTDPIPPEAPTGTLSVPMDADDLLRQVSLIQEIMSRVMIEGEHYGVIPGTGSKPALLKPGAEKICMTFRLHPKYTIERTCDPLGHREYEITCSLYNDGGGFVGEGVGTCTTMETKYRYRQGERICPHCNKPAIIKGRAEYGGGWLCFAKKDGCGAKWNDGDPVIESQKTERVENPDLADSYNTVKKMAKKRALVDAVQTNTACSDLFVQDLEDGEPASPIRRQEETRTYPPVEAGPPPANEPPPQQKNTYQPMSTSPRYELFFERPGPTDEQKKRLKATGYRYNADNYSWRGPDSDDAGRLFKKALLADNVDTICSRDIIGAHAEDQASEAEFEEIESELKAEPPSSQWATQDFLSPPKIDFLKTLRDAKDKMHTATYYEILNTWGMKHANEVHPQDVLTMNDVIKDMDKAIKTGARI